jgi:hypothetical protein
MFQEILEWKFIKGRACILLILFVWYYLTANSQYGRMEVISNNRTTQQVLIISLFQYNLCLFLNLAPYFSALDKYIFLLWEKRETKWLSPLCRKQEFYYGSTLRGDNFSKPWAPISVRRWVIYPPGGLCNQGFFAVYGSQVVRKTNQLQRNKLITEFSLNSPIDCGHSYRKPFRT